MVAALLVMLLVGFAMGVTVCEILVSRPARKDANDNLRVAQRATATATNWERIAEKTMRQTFTFSPPIEIGAADQLVVDFDDHSKSAELRVVVPRVELVDDERTLCDVHEAGACPPGCEHAYNFADNRDHSKAAELRVVTS